MGARVTLTATQASSSWFRERDLVLGSEPARCGAGGGVDFNESLMQERGEVGPAGGASTLFVHGMGGTAPVWVLIGDDDLDDEHSYALTFTDLLEGQRAMRNEIEEAEFRCGC